MKRKNFSRLTILVLALCPIFFNLTRTGLAETLSLGESIRKGVFIHPLVLFAKGELKSASGSVWKKISPPDPVLHIQNEWIPRGAGISDYGEQSVSISQTLDFPLVTFFEAKSAQYSKGSRHSSLKLAIEQATAEITMAYVDVWLAQQNSVIAESSHLAISLLARNAQVKYEAGEGTSIESDRLKAQAEQSHRNLQEASLNLSLAKNRLGQLVGRDWDTSLQVLDPGRIDTAFSSVWPAPSNTFLIQEAELALKSARAQRMAARLSWMPQIEFELSRQRDDLGGRFWGGGVGFSIPLWFPLGGTGSLKSASGSVEKAEAELESIKRQWNLKWREATQSFEIAKSRVESLELIGLPSAHRAYQASIIAYDLGELGVTDLLVSFLEKQEADRDYLDAQREMWEWKTRIDVLKAKNF